MSDQELVAKQEHVWDTIATLCTPFTEREWKTPTDCPGWSVQDQIAHIVGTESWLLGQPVPAHTPKDMSHVKNELGQWIEPWVDRCRLWPGARVLAEFSTVTRERRRVLHTMSAEEFTREFHTPIGSHTMRSFLPIRIFDNWVHEQDIRRAVGRPGHFAGPVAEHSLERVARAMSFVVDGMDPSSCTPARVSVMMRVARIITPFTGGSTMRQITTLGIDTAKQVFQLHGVDVQGNVILHKRVTRKQVLPLLAQLPPCLVGLEACGGSHYWAREITKLGHTVKLMAPQAVKPYVQGNKTDGRDAEGICEAASRPRGRAVAINSAADQDMQTLHRVREHCVKMRTALANQLRGVLGE
jgi:uncharacterized protein (TIGR03083 family)